MGHLKGETGTSTNIERLTDKQKRDLKRYKEENRHKDIAPAPIKPPKMFRKHGSGEIFSHKNT